MDHQLMMLGRYGSTPHYYYDSEVHISTLVGRQKSSYGHSQKSLSYRIVPALIVILARD